jgi:uncharacterized protein (DUF2235 family)
MRNFEPGDNVYVFGFSRGAYTARSLCGMLHAVGLLTLGNEGLTPYAIRMIKQRKIDFDVAFDFKRTFSRECKPHFVGVWDTVSSVGWVYNAVRFPFTAVTHNPDLAVVRHAISIDERRAFFRQNLFGKPADPKQDVKEVWFAGVHSDVGGSYPEAESQLSKIALRWMICEAELAGLAVDQTRKAEILGGKPPNVAPDPNSKNQHESLHGLWWIAELCALRERRPRMEKGAQDKSRATALHRCGLARAQFGQDATRESHSGVQAQQPASTTPDRRRPLH